MSEENLVNDQGESNTEVFDVSKPVALFGVELLLWQLTRQFLGLVDFCWAR